MLFRSPIKWRRLPSKLLLLPRPALRPTLMRNYITSGSHSTKTQAKVAPALFCEVDAEPLERYRKGGYHPAHLGDNFKDRQYKIVHKLGWGGYATVWLAKDFVLDRHVAIKILVSELPHDDHEVHILDLLSRGPVDHPGKKHIMQLLDHFEHTGPNGIHTCLVLELLGPSVLSKAESYRSNRLPGTIAWEVSKQTVRALAYIHANGVAHGDLHPGNIVFSNSTVSRQSDRDVLESLGKPIISDVHANYGYSLTPHIPRYLILPTSFPFSVQDPKSCQVKIVDFGEAFLDGQQRNIHCPLVFRAPETVLNSQRDLQADIWSLGCTIFGLIVGYPPFDTFFPNKVDLIREWIAMFGDLPDEWRDNTPPKKATEDLEIEPMTLTDWLHETYYDDEKSLHFSKEDIEDAGDLLQSIMKYHPADRPRAAELQDHSWFQRNPFRPTKLLD